MRAGTYIKYVATCLPTALIGIGIFLAIFRANPHLGLYSGIAALIVWASLAGSGWLSEGGGRRRRQGGPGQDQRPGQSQAAPGQRRQTRPTQNQRPGQGQGRPRQKRSGLDRQLV